MPRYEYRCTQCGESLEVVQGFADEPLTVCPSCTGRLRKVFSPVGVVFKGSGFYKTDSRSKPAAKTDAAKTDGTPKEGAAAGGDAASGGDAKPAAAAKPDGDKPATTTSPAGKGATHKVA